MAALFFLVALAAPNVWLPAETDNRLRAAFGLHPHHPVPQEEFAQVCREWPELTMCKASKQFAGH